MKPFILTMSLLAVLASCSHTTEIEEMIDPLSDSEFNLTIDRKANLPAIQFPASELQESHYIPLTEEKFYAVVFSNNVQHVTITPNAIPNVTGPMIGVKEQSTTNKQYFTLTSGAFAGGRFVVWAEDMKWQCELTLYGSGVPIILSERGLLVKGQQ